MAALSEGESSFSRSSRCEDPIDELFLACLANQRERERKRDDPLLQSKGLKERSLTDALAGFKQHPVGLSSARIIERLSAE